MSNDAATATMRIVVQSRDLDSRVQEVFGAVGGLVLSNFPGLYLRQPATSSGPVMEHWPALIDSRHIIERVYMNGEVTKVLPTSQLGLNVVNYSTIPYEVPAKPVGKTTRLPFGRLFGARSGDKGGAANVGVWAKTEESYAFVYHFLTIERLKQLLPDVAACRIERYELPNVRGLNFMIYGVLGDGVPLPHAPMDRQSL